MKYTGPIFRPPPEASTLQLKVTVGCSHTKCSFCTMYKKTSFSIETMEQIEADLQEARGYTYYLVFVSSNSSSEIRGVKIMYK